ncbi:hypothetical protein KR032_000147 [Drosophila birchii]|nr:hypothetical protein KR032_000147 [Drosophila birchii]
METCKLEDFIIKGNGDQMITAQQCLQMKRDMEAGNHTDFEVSPLALCMMITLLLFGICLWIWLISWSCFFGQNLDIVVKKEEKNPRLSGGKNQRSKNNGTCFTKYQYKNEDLSVRSRILRNCNPISDYNHIVHPGSFRQEGQTSAITDRMETKMTESPTTYDTTGSSLEKASSKPPKKYKIKWTKFLNLGRSGGSQEA